MSQRSISPATSCGPALVSISRQSKTRTNHKGLPIFVQAWNSNSPRMGSYFSWRWASTSFSSSVNGVSTSISGSGLVGSVFFVDVSGFSFSTSVDGISSSVWIVTA